MLHQRLATLLALFLLQTSLCRTAAILPSEVLDARDALNATIDARDDNHPLTPGERNMLNEQNNAYKGIFWDLAYPGGNGPDGTAGSPQDGGCYVYQYNILVEATRNAVRLARFSGADLVMEDRSFNKYFVRNSVAPIGGRWTSNKDAQNTYASIRHNMLQPSRFPLDGTGRRRRRDRVGYQCKDTSYLPSDSKGCAGGVTAYTANTNITPDGWTIVFCPIFFENLKYLNEILAGPKLNEGDLGALKYQSYEQTILHEWLHTDVFGYSEHLVDVKDQIDDGGPTRKVYGESEARTYAWKFMKGNKMNINTKIVANVENYVWYWVDKMYSAQWSWTGNGNSYPPKNKREVEAREDVMANTLDLGNDTLDASLLPPASFPANCHGNLAIDTTDTSALVCDYVNPPDEEDSSTTSSAAPTVTTKPPVVTLPPDPKNCNCNESGCTPESPSCCANGTC